MQRQKGFTLLELIVVTLIIGVIVGSVSLSSGLNRQVDVKEEIERLAALIDLAAQESVFKSTEIAVEFEENSYRFLTLVENEWQPIEADRLLRERQLPAGLEIELFIEGEEKEIFSVKTEGSDKKNIPPRIFLLSSGELTPFEISLKGVDGDTLYTLVGQINGQLAIKKIDAKAS
ncbi:MAG: type II secretion system protein GspH [Gammaproteobacteria bacterium]|nr:type II secretion system minor pseudopilin GspH [Gammaproteobacteria bacterium]PCH64283.1 MAG: type II secretion system protein GspH [Gammaproteobacteria bacterium]